MNKLMKNIDIAHASQLQTKQAYNRVAKKDWTRISNLLSWPY